MIEAQQKHLPQEVDGRRGLRPAEPIRTAAFAPRLSQEEGGGGYPQQVAPADAKEPCQALRVLDECVGNITLMPQVIPTRYRRRRRMSGRTLLWYGQSALP
ncbi:MAG: hypothetical protein P4M09_31635 [Devosia sp.]|nr:hypothetical protein [Devosia sp.]